MSLPTTDVIQSLYILSTELQSIIRKLGTTIYTPLTAQMRHEVNAVR